MFCWMSDFLCFYKYYKKCRFCVYLINCCYTSQPCIIIIFYPLPHRPTNLFTINLHQNAIYQSHKTKLYLDWIAVSLTVPKKLLLPFLSDFQLYIFWKFIYKTIRIFYWSFKIYWCGYSENKCLNNI